MELECGGRRYPVPAGELSIGADPGCGVVLAGILAHHAAIRSLGDRMATIRLLAPGAVATVNGVEVGPEPTPLLHGDVIRVGAHELTIRNPSHPAGGPTAPPAGARERLQDTLFGLPRRPAAVPAPPALPEPAPATEPRRRVGIVLAALISLALLAYLLLR